MMEYSQTVMPSLIDWSKMVAGFSTKKRAIMKTLNLSDAEAEELKAVMK